MFAVDDVEISMARYTQSSAMRDPVVKPARPAACVANVS